jgi:hypothetical protein
MPRDPLRISTIVRYQGVSKCKIIRSFQPPYNRIRSGAALLDVLHQSFSDIIGSGFEIAFGVNADDRFCIGGPEVYPVRIKFYLEAILRVNRIVLVFFPDLLEDRPDVCAIFQFDLVLRNEIVGIVAAK